MSRAVEPSLPFQCRMSALNSLLFKRIVGDTRCESRLFPIITRAWSSNASPEDDSTDRPTVSHCRGKEQHKIVRAAVVGAPNAGKSTLTNALIGHKVCACARAIILCRHVHDPSFSPSSCGYVAQ